jgi:hypothetical protein
MSQRAQNKSEHYLSSIEVSIACIAKLPSFVSVWNVRNILIDFPCSITPCKCCHYSMYIIKHHYNQHQRFKMITCGSGEEKL